MKVLGKHLDGVLDGGVGQLSAQLVLYGRKNQSVIGVLGGVSHSVGAGKVSPFQHRLGDNVNPA